MSVYPFIVAAFVFLVGLYGLVSSPNLLHLVMSLTVVQSSTYVLLIAVGYRSGAQAPLFPDIPLGTAVVDPVVQALTVVDFVVEATVTALLLAVAVQAHKRFGTLELDELRPLRG
jgi:multicomponent Na+:H+ antiporter subunit C